MRRLRWVMGKTIRVLSLSTATALLLLAPAAGQILVEHAAAAAGAAGGAAAGKAASDALNNLGNLLGGAARTGEPKQEVQEVKPKPEKPVKTTPQKAAGTSARAANAGAPSNPVGGGGYAPDTAAGTDLQPSTGPVPLFAAQTAAEPVQARNEDLERVQPGMSRSEVLALGDFGSRISIPDDDGHLREVLQYDHATVRIEDGKVTSVSRN